MTADGFQKLVRGIALHDCIQGCRNLDACASVTCVVINLRKSASELWSCRGLIPRFPRSLAATCKAIRVETHNCIGAHCTRVSTL